MDKSNLTLGVALVAVVIAIGAYFVDPQLPQQVGQAGQKFGAVLDSLPYDFFVASNNGGYWNGVPIGKNATASNGILEKASVGSCNPTATSTIISVQNPFGATSTIIYASLSGVNGATSTDIVVGTSTTPNPGGVTAIATSSAMAGLFGISNLSANVGFYSVAGQTLGPGLGYTQPFSGPYVSALPQVAFGVAGAVSGSPVASTTPPSRMVVGPLEWIVGFSTTTGIQTAGSFATTTPASCTYKLLWES